MLELITKPMELVGVKADIYAVDPLTDLVDFDVLGCTAYIKVVSKGEEDNQWYEITLESGQVRKEWMSNLKPEKVQIHFTGEDMNQYILADCLILNDPITVIASWVMIGENSSGWKLSSREMYQVNETESTP